MNPRENTTIAAIATPPGHGGIGVIRLSGPDSLPLLLRFLPGAAPGDFPPHHSRLRHLLHPETGHALDDAVVTYYQAPHSFTGDDVVEISCHGAPVVLSEIIRLLKSLGAELAQPGEFSMRAFLNQRMDLTQAEAIHDLISARTNFQARLAARQLRGELSGQIRPFKDSLIEMIVHFESAVEFVEDDLDALDRVRFSARLGALCAGLERMISSYRLGRLVRSGVRMALIGKPNAGKSSLFNALLGRDRAIVTHIPGTTRDTLAESLSLGGIQVELIDTAGIHETTDIVEQLGVARSRSAISDADFVIAVADAGTEITEQEKELFTSQPVSLFVLNKTDLGAAALHELQQLAAARPVVAVSALTGAGLDQLREAIHTALTAGMQTDIEGGIITNERHYAALEQALTDMQKAACDLNAGRSEEVVLVSLHAALRDLGIVTGETLIGDIINQIFSTFCIGK
ncbi:MAG: tRNA uridine-5-carboxymethylaminomethyl(34) synthesis GTPase MnmE [Blastocatellia bacterium]